MVSCNSVLKRDLFLLVIKVSRFRPMQVEHFLHKCPLANNLSFGRFRMLTPRDQQVDAQRQRDLRKTCNRSCKRRKLCQPCKDTLSTTQKSLETPRDVHFRLIVYDRDCGADLHGRPLSFVQHRGHPLFSFHEGPRRSPKKGRSQECSLDGSRTGNVCRVLRGTECAPNTIS